MYDGVARFFTRFGGGGGGGGGGFFLLLLLLFELACGRRSLVSGTQNEIVVELPCEG